MSKLSEIIDEFDNTPLKKLNKWLNEFEEKSLEKILRKRFPNVEPKKDIYSQIYKLREKELEESEETEESEDEIKEILEKLENTKIEKIEKSLRNVEDSDIKKIFENLFENRKVPKTRDERIQWIKNFYVLETKDLENFEIILLPLLEDFLLSFKVDDIRSFAKKRYMTETFTQSTKSELVKKIISLRKIEISEETPQNEELDILKRVTQGVRKTSEIDWDPYHQTFRTLPARLIILDSTEDAPKSIRKGGTFALSGQNIEDSSLPTTKISSSEKKYGKVVPRKSKKSESTLDIDVEKLENSSGNKGYSIRELQEFLSEIGMTTSGGKKDLVNRLHGYLKSQMI